MQRRRFLQLLGLAPVAIAAAKFAPKNPCRDIKLPPDPTVAVISDHHFGPVTEVNENWKPNYCYKAGDKVVINGEVFTVTWAGISGGCRPLRREEFMDKMDTFNPWGTTGLTKI